MFKMFARLLSVGDLYGDESDVLSTTQETNTSGGESITGFDFAAIGIDNQTADLVIFIIAGLVVFALAVYITLLFLRKRAHRKNRLNDFKNTVFLEIAVPRESVEDGRKNESISDTKDVIGIGEQLFYIMSEFATAGFGRWFRGGERFSLEIVNIDQKIRFWLVCSKRTADPIQRQIMALYPTADVTQIKKTGFFKENTVAYAQEMQLSGRHELPFKTYRRMEQDPLNTLTNSISSLQKGESAAIQLVISPRKNRTWQNKPRQLATEIQQGQSPERVFKKGGVGSAIGGFGKEMLKDVFTSSKKDDQFNQQDKEREIDLTGRKQAVQLTPQQQEIVKQLEEKAMKPGFEFVIRIVASAGNEARAKQIVETVIPTFQIFDVRPFNSIERLRTSSKASVYNFLLRSLNHSDTDVLNTEELNSLWHVPNYLVRNPNIKWLPSKKPSLPLEIPTQAPGNIHVGTAKSGMQQKEVYLTQEDRFRHSYILGGSGSGKSVLMTNMILQDIQNGSGVCVIDPHGQLVDDVLLRMDQSRKDDVVVFSPAITDFPLGLNMLEYDRSQPTQKTIVIDTLFSIWDKLYDLKSTGGPMFESYMKNAMKLVMGHEESGATLMEIPKVLTDEDFRAFKLAMCDDDDVVNFWEKEAGQAGGEASLENMVPYITSKLSPFLTNDFIRPMVGQQKSAINFREAMDNKKVILVKLEKGLIGETSAFLVGMVIVGNLLMAGMSRNDGMKYNEDGTKTPCTAEERIPFFVYIDEMQNFLFDAIPKALEEIRKYKVGFHLAHQFIKQLSTKEGDRIKDSIMANTATKFIYRVSAEDAEYLSKEFSPTLSPTDLQNPEKYSCNAIILANGQRTTPFNIKPPMFTDQVDRAFFDSVIEQTKKKYGKSLEDVEKEIKDRTEKFMF